MAVLADHGTRCRHDLPARLLELLGPGSARNATPIVVDDLAREPSRMAVVLEGLDQLVRRPGGLGEPGPSARWLLPRAVALAELWGPGPSAAAQPHYSR